MFVMALLVRMPNFIIIRQCEQINDYKKFAGEGEKEKEPIFIVGFFSPAPTFQIFCFIVVLRVTMVKRVMIEC